MVLLPKEGGGERTITLTFGIYRLLMSIRKPWTSTWEQGAAGFWDSAVRGSSALRAAILREAKSEISGALGSSVLEILWSMEKLYDVMSQEEVARMAIQLQYPTVLLYLGLIVHRSSRVLSIEETCSLPVVPHRSLVAGCMQSVAWTRCFLFDVLAEVHARYRPNLQVHRWVDDLSQRGQGPRAVVLQQSPGMRRVLSVLASAQRGPYFTQVLYPWRAKPCKRAATRPKGGRRARQNKGPVP